MPTTTPIAPSEEPEFFKGGFPMLKAAAQRAEQAKGGVASQTTKNTVKNKNAGASAKPPTTSPVNTSGISSAANTALGVAVSAANLPGLSPLSELASRLTAETSEVTLFSKYYPQDQPLLARMIMNFPSKVEDTVTKSLGLGDTKSFPNQGGLSLSSASTSSLNQSLSTTETTQFTSGSNTFSSFGSTNLIGGVASTNPFASNLASSVATNPVFSDAIKDGDFLEVRPNNLLGLDYERIYNGIGRFTITLFDPQWDKIEKKLVANRGYFRFKYGYTDADPASFSPWYIARAFTYKIDFGMEGNTITLSGFTTGYSLNFSKTFSAAGIKGENIGQIASDLAQSMGYLPIVESTRPVTSRDGLDSTELTNKIINFTAQSNYMGIISELAKYAVNADGQGNYVFFIRVTETGDKEFHFHTITYETKKNNPPSATTALTGSLANPNNLQASASESATALGGASKIPAFTMFRNKNQATIRFTPNWAMTVAQLTGGGGTVAPIIDVTNKNVTISNLNMDNNPQTMDGKGNIAKLQVTDYLDPKYKDEEKLKAFNFMVTPERSPDQIIAVTQAAFSKFYPGAITANLEIFGTPNFYLTQKIAVIVYKPQSDSIIATADNVHWISGFFRISGIKDSIRAGRFTTVFDLISDSRGSVAPDKVNLIQSK